MRPSWSIQTKVIGPPVVRCAIRTARTVSNRRGTHVLTVESYAALSDTTNVDSVPTVIETSRSARVTGSNVSKRYVRPGFKSAANASRKGTIDGRVIGCWRPTWVVSAVVREAR